MFFKKKLPVMKIQEAKFVGSSTNVEQKPREALPEFAFIGRSNVGKSSLINSLCANGRLAMTSSRPGKTRLVNHFIINREWYLVDLPGYGYAKASRTDREKIEDVIRNYLNFSKELKHLFVLVDSRHDLTKADAGFIRELGTSDIAFSVIFTKADKMGPVAGAKQMAKCERMIADQLGFRPRCFASSSETGQGREEILNHIETLLSE